MYNTALAHSKTVLIVRMAWCALFVSFETVMCSRCRRVGGNARWKQNLFRNLPKICCGPFPPSHPLPAHESHPGDLFKRLLLLRRRPQPFYIACTLSCCRNRHRQHLLLCVTVYPSSAVTEPAVPPSLLRMMIHTSLTSLFLCPLLNFQTWNSQPQQRCRRWPPVQRRAWSQRDGCMRA